MAANMYDEKEGKRESTGFKAKKINVFASQSNTCLPI